MKKTVTITTNNRPEYFDRAMATVLPQFGAGWEIHLFSEPPANGIRYPKLGRNHINDRRLGAHLNIFASLWHVFEDLKSDLNVQLDEDVVLSPDVANLADWYAENAKFLTTTIALCPYSDTISDATPTDTLVFRPGFTSMCAVMTRANWCDFVRRYAFYDPRGYDHSLNEAAIALNRGVIAPQFSRLMHIGEHGLHVTPELNHRLFDGKLFYQGQAIKDFRLI